MHHNVRDRVQSNKRIGEQEYETLLGPVSNMVISKIRSQHNQLIVNRKPGNQSRLSNILLDPTVINDQWRHSYKVKIRIGNKTAFDYMSSIFTILTIAIKI